MHRWLLQVTALPDFADDPNEAAVFNKTGFNKRQWRAAGGDESISMRRARTHC